MLKRITEFLLLGRDSTGHATTSLPALFLVLPIACTENSRYLDEPLLLRIMASLGFALQKSKITPKLCYYLFHWTGKADYVEVNKRKLRDGPAMNNFCIVLK
jgi:25S rRNA (adenine2142-N1)-methyltransferase